MGGIASTDIRDQSGRTDQKGYNGSNPRQQVMLFLFDLAKLAESPARQRRPTGAGDLLSAMAAKVGTIEHVAVELGTKNKGLS